MTTSAASRSHELTPRQTEVLEVIRRHIEATGAPPTRAEIADKLGFRSVNAAEDHLKALARKGAIELTPGTSRGIKLSGIFSTGIPVIENPSPSETLLAQKHITSRFKVDRAIFDPKPDFLFKVKDNALQPSGIYEGDLIAFHKSESVPSGKIVLVKYDGKYFVRRYYLQGNTVVLKADNSTVPDITIGQGEPYTLEAQAVGIIRSKAL